MSGRSFPINNIAGALAPLTSPWGEELFDHTEMLIAHPPAIGRQSGEFVGGTIGGFLTTQANVQGLFAPGGYFGDAPLDLQPEIESAPPWERP